MATAVLIAVLAGIDAVLVDELEPLYPDQAPLSGIERLDAPRGSRAGVHVVCSELDPGTPIDLTVRGAGTLPVQWFRLGDVPVEENTGPDSRTERWDKAENPHVIRDAPFRVYEVLEPVNVPVTASAGQMAIRLEVEVPVDAEPGDRDLVIHVGQGDDTIERPLVLGIHAATVRPIGEDTLGYTNWFSVQEMADRHGLTQWGEEHWDMIARYAAMMARGRQTMFWVPWSDFFNEHEGVWVLDAERLRRFIAVFSSAGLHWIEGAPIARRPGGDWSRPDLELRLGSVPMTGEEGRRRFAAQAAQMRALIESEGWRDRWVQHIADEPTDVNAQDYAVAAGMMRDALPGVPIFEATMSRGLVDAVDMWCPQVQAWHAHRAFFEDRHDAGDSVWVYTCLRPGGPWLNRLLDQERLRQVYFGWGAVEGDWDGYLHWGLNHYKADPFSQSVVDHPAMPDTDNRLPAGDTHVLYPGDGGPWSGLRFEAHRIGMEDHDLLSQHAARDGSDVEVLIREVYRAPDDWEPDVEKYRRVRRGLLEALSMTSPPRIEVLGFSGCPMTPSLLASARAAAASVSGDLGVTYVDLEALPRDDPMLRWPAPTLLIDGVDLLGLEPSPTPAMACRVYPGGVPGVELIRDRLAARASD